MHRAMEPEAFKEQGEVDHSTFPRKGWQVFVQIFAPYPLLVTLGDGNLIDYVLQACLGPSMGAQHVLLSAGSVEEVLAKLLEEKIEGDALMLPLNGLGIGLYPDWVGINLL